MPNVGAYASEERRPAVALPWIIVGIALGAVLLVHRETFASLVSVWRQSDTFAHCFIIPAICLFLVWRRRDRLAAAPLEVSWAGLAAVLALSLAWAIAHAANVQVGEQLAAVLLVPAVVVALLGRSAARTIAFPLAYLLFAVPFGEVLIPVLMDWTASFTVAALRATGIPVFREGFFFSIPTGDFEVAKACSGIRYLIACAALGVLYAWLSYSSWRKRALFVAVSLVAPIIANGIRAYLIVMIAHLSSMRLAVGADHLVYGWIFFGALVLLLFWIGNKFADVPAPAPSTSGAASMAERSAPFPIAVAAVAAVALSAAGPALLRAHDFAGPTAVRPTGLPLVDGWDGPRGAPERWYAELVGPRELRATYGRGAAEVELDVWLYDRQREGAEMVGAVDSLFDPRREPLVRNGRAAALPSGLEPREVVLHVRGMERVVWYWYVVGDTPTAADWYAKALEAWLALARGGSASSLVILKAESPDAAVARAQLADFALAAAERIDGCLGSAAGCAAPP